MKTHTKHPVHKSIYGGQVHFPRKNVSVFPVKYGSELTDGFNVGYHVTVTGIGARNNTL